MFTSTIYELIGYLGSNLVVVSPAMSSVITLRFVYVVGALDVASEGMVKHVR